MEIILTEEQAEKAWAGMKDGLIELGVSPAHEEFTAENEARKSSLKQHFVQYWTSDQVQCEGYTPSPVMAGVDSLYPQRPVSTNRNQYYVGIRSHKSYPGWDFDLTRRVHEHILRALGIKKSPMIVFFRVN